MKNALLAAALCFSVFSVPMTAQAGDFTGDSFKKCGKQPSAKCLDQFPDMKKAFEDIAAGRKPSLSLTSLPGLDGLSIGDLGKLMSVK